jgi:light-regulated signal transduction histidine kinase (bacteriophytochrome)
MSISLICRGRLWGLISATSNLPTVVPFATRTFCRLVGGIMSSQIERLLTLQANLQRAAVNRIASSDLVVDDLHSALKPSILEMIRVFEADYAMLRVSSSEFKLYGDRRPKCKEGIPAAICDYDKWAVRPREKIEGIRSSNCIGRDFDGLYSHPHLAGVLQIYLDQECTTYIAFCRQEEATKVFWAGKPEKILSNTGDYLLPRTSFARWEEERRGFSRDWGNVDHEAAATLGRCYSAFIHGKLIGQSLFQARISTNVSSDIDIQRSELES